MRNELINLLQRGSFNIRQWASNHKHALDNLGSKEFDFDGSIKRESVSKTLGVTWNSRLDKFVYSVKNIDLPNHITKRHILSEIPKIFDPPGFLGPIILCAKAIMQDCWRAKCDWDESVSQVLHSRWVEFARQLGGIRDFMINRRIVIDNPATTELHGFCDASQTGYICVLPIYREIA